MKNIKNIFLTVASTMALFSTQLSTAGTSGLLKSIQGPGFELYNKAPQTISVALLIDGKLVEAKNVGTMQKFLKTIDLKNTVRIGIFNKQLPPTNISTGLLSGAITPQPDAIYELNAPGKTKYVTYNPAKTPHLYPQTGTFMGLSGKSDSGYPLGDNLQQSQIVLKK
jgi:hypothetical protein